MHKKTVLKNGLRIITKKIEGTKAVTCLVLVGAGSRYETKEINGLSHFLEHMFFKGAEVYKNTKEVSSAIDSVGGDFNAFTGKEYAGYYVKVAKEHKDVALSVLSDMMLNARFDTKEIEKERGVILEELNMYKDTPMYQVGWDFEKLMFGDQPLGWDQIGTKELIKSATQKDFIDYKNALYTPDNTVIALAGDIDHEEALKEVEKYFKFEDRKRGREIEKFKEGLADKNLLLEKKKTEQAHLVLGVSACSYFEEDQYATKLLATILGGNMSSRMFLRVREAKGLAYYIQTSIDAYSDTGILSTRAGVDLKRAPDAVKAIREEYLMIVKEGVSEEELQKAKNYFKGKIVLKIEDSEEYAHFLSRQELLRNEIKSPEEMMMAIDQVTVADIKRIAEDIFKPENMKLALIGPFEEEQFLSILEG